MTSNPRGILAFVASAICAAFLLAPPAIAADGTINIPIPFSIDESLLPAGPQGPAGVDGQDGAQGEQGIPGQNGQDGQDGAAGPEGPQGVAGPASRDARSRSAPKPATPH